MNIDHIFRAYDIRGIVDQDLTELTMEKIGKAFGTYLLKMGKTPKVAIGGDVRITTPQLLDAFIRGITSVGFAVDVIKQSPLGLTLFRAFQQHYAASAFITASHMPFEWNGVKFYWGEGIGFSPAENSEFKEIFDADEFVNKPAGPIEIVETYPDYVSYLKSKFDTTIFKKFKISIDAGNGATALVVPQLYTDLGFSVNAIFDEPNGRFPNRVSEPTVESLRYLSEEVAKNPTNFGAGFDGDGDRCVFTDETGKVISSDAFGLIVARYLLETHENKSMLINMECSQAMENFLKQNGADVTRIRVGHSFLSLEALKRNALWGVEASGHAIYPDVFLFDDALILPLLLAVALNHFNKSVAELVAEITMPISKRYDLKCPDQVKFQVVDELAEFFKNEEGETSDLDGVALSTNLGRILIRVSNTSPKVRMTIEAMEQSNYQQLEDSYLQIVKDKITELSKN